MNIKEFSNKELTLISEAVDYLLGAELLEEDGWTLEDIEVLHSIQSKIQERKTGHWRLKAEWHNHRYYGCSVCGREISSDELNIHIEYPKCPYCNADMKEKENE